MSLIVREITARQGMDDFLALPSEIYQAYPNRIPPVNSEVKRILDPSANPYFKNSILRMFICYSNSKAVCRSIMVINPHFWQKFNRKSAFFGFFESFNDKHAVQHLFDIIAEECRKAGAEYLEGPFNPNHYSELGILTDNFDSTPAFFETYNPPYYQELLIDAGLIKSNVFQTMVNKDIRSTVEKKYRHQSRECQCADIKIRKFNILKFRKDLEILREINNEAFRDNKYFLPLSKEEYLFSAKYLFLMTRPRLILIAEYKGEPVGAVQLVVNINSLLKNYNGKIKFWNIPSLLWKCRNINELIIFTAGIKKEFRNKRIFLLLLRSAVKIFRDYSSLSTTWMADEDLENTISRILDMSTGKHFALYSKTL